jgi:hypothetical protein
VSRHTARKDRIARVLAAVLFLAVVLGLLLIVVISLVVGLIIGRVVVFSRIGLGRVSFIFGRLVRTVSQRWRAGLRGCIVPVRRLSRAQGVGLALAGAYPRPGINAGVPV